MISNTSAGQPSSGSRRETTGATRAASVPDPATPSLDAEMAATESAGSTPDELRKKQLIDEVVERSGIKKKYAKPVVEAMLAVLGEAVAAGTTMNLQPLGKVMLQRTNEKASGRVSIVRIRQSGSGGQNPGKDPLASAAE